MGALEEDAALWSALRRGPRWRFAAPVAGMLVLEWLLVRPLPMRLAGGDDKLAHAAAFGVLAALWWWALGGWSGSWRRPFGAAVLAAGWGLAGEVQQLFVPGRSAELLDFVADLVGAAVAVLAAELWRRVRTRRLRRSAAPA